MRAVRGAVWRIRLEGTREAGTLPGRESGGRDARLPPEYTGLQFLRLERRGGQIHFRKRAVGAWQHRGNENVDQHRAWRDVGRAGGVHRRKQADKPPGAVRRGGAGRRAGADRCRGRAEGPFRGGGCGLGRRQGELGHPVSENIRRHEGRKGLGGPGRFSASLLPQKGRDSPANCRLLYRQRLSFRAGLPVHGGQVRPAHIRH